MDIDRLMDASSKAPFAFLFLNIFYYGRHQSLTTNNNKGCPRGFFRDVPRPVHKQVLRQNLLFRSMSKSRFRSMSKSEWAVISKMSNHVLSRGLVFCSKVNFPVRFWFQSISCPQGNAYSLIPLCLTEAPLDSFRLTEAPKEKEENRYVPESGGGDQQEPQSMSGKGCRRHSANLRAHLPDWKLHTTPIQSTASRKTCAE